LELIPNICGESGTAALLKTSHVILSNETKTVSKHPDYGPREQIPDPAATFPDSPIKFPAKS
jgi:hypothetical protein